MPPKHETLEDKFSAYKATKISYFEEVYHEAVYHTDILIHEENTKKTSELLNKVREIVGDRTGDESIIKGHYDDLLRAAINDEPFLFMGKTFNPED